MWKGLDIYFMYTILYTTTVSIFGFIDIVLLDKIPYLKSLKINPVPNKDMEVLYKKVTKSVMINIWLYTLLLVPVMEYMWTPVYFVSYYNSIKDYIFIIFLSEIPFYLLHRLMHTKYLRVYHQVHHVHTNHLIGMVSLYTHPLDYLIANILPSIIIPVLLNTDIFTTKLFICTATLNTIIAHIGYLPIHTHDIHHLELKVNYGYSLYMDKLLNTEKLTLKDK